MINHIVMWKFRPDITAEARDLIAAQMKQGMEGVSGKLDGISSLDVIIEPLDTSNCDILLVSSFDTEEALAAYQGHPQHEALKSSLMPSFASRSCIDYHTI